MSPAARTLLGLGALVMALAVALGAYAAHAAAGAAHPEAGRLLQAALLYQMVHGLGIVASGILARERPSRWLVAASALHGIGTVCFCGALWRLALTGISSGPVAPIGGVAFILGWVSLAVFAFRAR